MTGTPFNNIPARPDPDLTDKAEPKSKVVKTEENGVHRRSDCSKHPPV